MAASNKQPASPPGGSSAPADVNLTSDKGEGPSPTLPHERDEAGGITDGTPSRRVQQGSDDVKRGLSDTSRGEATDRTYDRLKK